jgi:hypothetical protein
MRKRRLVFILVLLLGALMISCSSSKSTFSDSADSKKFTVDSRPVLTDKTAKEAAEMLLAQEESAKLLSWEFFPNEKIGKASILILLPSTYYDKAYHPIEKKSEQKLTGKFIFHETSNGWIIDQVDFSSPETDLVWRKEIFPKVE